MLLAFTQEDFLVFQIVLLSFWSPFHLICLLLLYILLLSLTQAITFWDPKQVPDPLLTKANVSTNQNQKNK